MKKVSLLIIAFVFAMPVVVGAQGFTADFGLGARGEHVKMLQTLLSADKNIYPEGLVTGYFGQATERAVKRFQKEKGIEQAGRIGPKTRNLLNELLKEGKISYTSSQHVPMIFETFATSTSPSTAYIFWSANMNTTSELWLSTTTPLNPLTAQKYSGNQRGLYHYQNLSGLSGSTKYFYLIKITDEKGNSATSTERFLVTSSI